MKHVLAEYILYARLGVEICFIVETIFSYLHSWTRLFLRNSFRLISSRNILFCRLLLLSVGLNTVCAGCWTQDNNCNGYFQKGNCWKEWVFYTKCYCCDYSLAQKADTIKAVLIRTSSSTTIRALLEYTCIDATDTYAPLDIQEYADLTVYISCETGWPYWATIQTSCFGCSSYGRSISVPDSNNGGSVYNCCPYCESFSGTGKTLQCQGYGSTARLSFVEYVKPASTAAIATWNSNPVRAPGLFWRQANGFMLQDSTYFVDAPIARYGMSSSIVWLNDGSFFETSSADFDYLSMIFEGYFQPPATGTWTFYLTSDDSSFLWVNNVLLINNGKMQGETLKQGKMGLTGGTPYPVRIMFGEYNGAMTLKFEFEGPQVTRTSNLGSYFFVQEITCINLRVLAGKISNSGVTNLLSSSSTSKLISIPLTDRYVAEMRLMIQGIGSSMKNCSYSVRSGSTAISGNMNNCYLTLLGGYSDTSIDISITNESPNNCYFVYYISFLDTRLYCAAGKQPNSEWTGCDSCPVGKWKSEKGNGMCSECDSNSYTSLVGSTKCTACPANADCSSKTTYYCIAGYQPDGNGGCSACPVGTFKSGTGNWMCSSCGTNTYSSSIGSTSCTACPSNADCSLKNTFLCNAGFQPNGNGGCSACPAGTFKIDSGNTMCSSCPSGKYQDEVGKITCKPCPAGTSNPLTGRATLSSCIDCQRGYYQELTGQSSCNPCPAGTKQDQIKATSVTACKPCDAGSFQASSGAGSCILCKAGTFQIETGKTECNDCSIGQYQNNIGSTSCNDCPAGQYQEIAGSGLCINCPAGQYQDQTGRSSCKNCPIGQYQNRQGQVSCSVCEPGYYADTERQLSCLTCPANSVCSTTGFQCAAGFQINVNLNGCNPCTAGSYKPSNGNSQCQPCPAGWFSSTAASVSCTSCSPGYFQDNKGASSCKSCQAGRFQELAGASTCDNCPKGQYQDQTKGTECKNCPVGTFQDIAGSSLCKSCPSGQYQDHIGAISCKMCPIGYSQSLQGQSSCLPCTTGTYSTQQGLSSCVSCPSNSICMAEGFTCRAGYQKSPSGSSCVACAAGTFKSTDDDGLCVSCAPGLYSGTGSTECILCKEGMVFDVTTAQCVSCLAGTFAQMVSNQCTPCPAGSFSQDQSLECTECPAGTFSEKKAPLCTKCPNGLYAPKNSTECYNCPSGTRVDEDGTKCNALVYNEASSSSLEQLVAPVGASVGAVVVLIVSLFVYRRRKHAKKKPDNIEAQSSKSPQSTDFRTRSMTATSIRSNDTSFMEGVENFGRARSFSQPLTVIQRQPPEQQLGSPQLLFYPQFSPIPFTAPISPPLSPPHTPNLTPYSTRKISKSSVPVVVPDEQMSIDMFKTCPAGSLILGKYILRGAALFGGTSVVRTAIDETSEKPVTIKLTLNPNDAFAELDMMKLIRSPYVVSLEDRVELPHNQSPFIIMERLDQSLHDFILKKPVEINTIKMVLSHIVAGIGTIHSFNVVHTDLKPQNIMFSFKEMQWKIIDLGNARMAMDETVNGVTPIYCPPELARALENHELIKAQFSFDMWQIGLILYFMFKRVLLFEGDEKEVLRKVANPEQHLPDLDSIPDEQARNVLRRLLESDPKKRLTIEGLRRSAFLNAGLDTLQVERAARANPSIVANTISEKLSMIAEDVKSVKELTEKAVMQIAATRRQIFEHTEYQCPRLAMLIPESGKKWNPKSWVSESYRLCLLCEHDEMHMTKHPGYQITKPKEFIQKAAPILSMSLTIIGVGLRLTTGIALPPAIMSFVSSLSSNPAFSFLQTASENDKIESTVGFLNKLNADMAPIFKDQDGGRQDEQVPAKIVGAALRQLKAELESLDPSSQWGGLQAVSTSEGEIRYVCEEHAKLYAHHQRSNEEEGQEDSLEDIKFELGECDDDDGDAE